MSESNDRLNGLLIDVGRSFLQYVGECWPWTVDSASETRQLINELVGLQSENVARLADYLDSVGHTIDFGTFPTEYTDKHFVALDYLIDLLVENQRNVIAEVEAVSASFDQSSDVSWLLDSTLAIESNILDSLGVIAEKRVVRDRS